jgi:acetoacetyl-CoA synthetase
MSTAHSTHQEPLYRPPAPEHSRTARFRARVNAAHGLALDSYADLYRWSIGGGGDGHTSASNTLAQFWSDVWDDVGVLGHKGAHVVDAHAPPAANPDWFTEARLNW